MKKNKLLLLALCWFFSVSLEVFSQSDNYAFQHFSVSDGLPNHNIYAITQDYLGFLWFGTDAGVAKYDGFKMKKYLYESDNPKSINGARTLNIFEDLNNDLWVVSREGISQYDRKNDCFKRYFIYPDSTLKEAYSDIYCSYMDSRGNLWILKYGGKLVIFDPQKNRTLYFKYDTDNAENQIDSVSNLFDVNTLGIRDPDIMALSEDKEGNVWVGTAKSGLNRFSFDDMKIKKYLHNPSDESSISSNFITSIKPDALGNLWIGTSNGLNYYDTKYNTFTSFKHEKSGVNSISNNFIFVTYVDDDAKVWLTSLDGIDCYDPTIKKFVNYNQNSTPSLTANLQVTLGGSDKLIWFTNKNAVNIFDKTTKRWHSLTHDWKNNTSLSTHRILSFYKDRSDIVWLGTYEWGIDKLLPVSSKKWKNYKPIKDNANSISSNVVFYAIESPFNPNILWIGTNNGLDKYDKAANKYTHYRYNLNNTNSISNNRVRCIYEEKPGQLWIGTENGLNFFDVNSKKFIRYKNDPKDSNSGNYIIKIFFDSENTMWISTYNGIAFLDKKTKLFLSFKKDINNYNGSPALAFYEDSLQDIWVSDFEGIYKYNKQEKALKKFNLSFSWNHKDDPIRQFYEDSKGRFWLIFQNSGLIQLDRETGQIIPFEKQKYFSGMQTRFIDGDLLGNIWIFTPTQFIKFNADLNSVQPFVKQDGLDLNRAIYNVSKTKSGEFLVGSENGLIFFQPLDLGKDSTLPFVAFTDVKLFNKSIINDTTLIKESVDVLKEIELSYEQNFITIEFAGLHYALPEENQYQYKLENYDKEWFFCGKSRTASYTNLNPGEYIFKVKASNSDGVWNNTEKSLKIIISPPFWETWWFRSSVVLFILFLILWVYNARVESFKRRSVLLKKEVDERTEQLSQKTEQLQNALEKLESQNIALNENAIVSTSDIKGNITFVNKQFCRYTQYTEEELIGNNHRIINSGLHPKEFWKEFWNTIAKGKPWRGEIKNKAKDGSFFWSDSAVVPVFSTDKKISEYLSIRFDITERKKAEEELKKQRELLKNTNVILEEKVLERTAQLDIANVDLESANSELKVLDEAKNSFLTMISHEIRTPLNGIMGGVSLLKDFDLPEDTIDFLEILEVSIKRLEAFTMRTLEISQFQTRGAEMIKKKNLDFSVLLKDQLAEIEAKTAEKELNTELKCDSKLQIQADNQYMNQAIESILDNAVYFSQKGGSIEIVTEVKNDELSCTISDRGVGFPEHMLGKVIKSFQGAVHNIDNKTGLSLYMTNQIAEAHDGSLTFGNRDGGGAFVKIVVPIS